MWSLRRDLFHWADRSQPNFIFLPVGPVRCKVPSILLGSRRSPSTQSPKAATTGLSLMPPATGCAGRSANWGKAAGGRALDQAAAVCHVMGEDGLEFCLVQTSSERWMFPNSTVCKRGPWVTAERAAYTVAGLQGTISKQPVTSSATSEPGRGGVGVAPMRSLLTAHAATAGFVPHYVGSRPRRSKATSPSGVRSNICGDPKRGREIAAETRGSGSPGPTLRRARSPASVKRTQLRRQAAVVGDAESVMVLPSRNRTPHCRSLTRQIWPRPALLVPRARPRFCESRAHPRRCPIVMPPGRCAGKSGNSPRRCACSWSLPWPPSAILPLSPRSVSCPPPGHRCRAPERCRQSLRARRPCPAWPPLSVSQPLLPRMVSAPPSPRSVSATWVPINGVVSRKPLTPLARALTAVIEHIIAGGGCCGDADERADRDRGRRRVDAVVISLWCTR
jgi:hypothetical protein